MAEVLSVVLRVGGLVLAALMLGLWLGERGRRKAAENYVVRGVFEATEAPAVSRVPPSPEERAARGEGRPVSDETIERALQDMEAELRARGVPYDREKLRKDIRDHMFWGEDVLE